MDESAVTHVSVNSRSWLAPVVLFGAAAVLLAGLAGPAAAGPLGQDGKIYACYKVKGKPKGALRVLPKAKARCKRGERKVAWIAVSPSGQPGAAGQQGEAAAPGSAGSVGSTGSSGSAGDSTGSTDSNLEAKVSSLNFKVGGLEDVLDGVTEGDLTGVLDKLGGITEEDLTEAVDASELVDEVCEQTSDLTDQVNALEGVIEGLGLNDALDLLGGLIEIPELPGALDPLPCPTP